MISYILKMRNLRQREFGVFAYGDSGRKWKTQIGAQVFLTPQTAAFSTTVHCLSIR